MSELLTPEEQMKKGHLSWVLYRIAFIGLGFCFLLSCLLIFWGVYPYNVLDVKNPPVPAHPQQVKAGNVVFLETDFCKHTSSQGRVNMFLILSTKEVTLPSFTDTSKKRCEVVQFPFIVPKDLEKGRAHVRFVIEYHVNPIRIITEVFSSREFEIVQ